MFLVRMLGLGLAFGDGMSRLDLEAVAEDGITTAGFASVSEKKTFGMI